MADERLIKSDDRVKDIGEVFTPQRIVDLMLDQPEITARVNDLKTTFLEPSAGEGVFLVEILKRKMKVALEQSKNIAKLEKFFNISASTRWDLDMIDDAYESMLINEWICSKGFKITKLANKTG
jgi:type I restriction-modification system DNA methylase subunit